MRGDLLIRGARVVVADRVLPVADVRVAGGLIEAVSEQPLAPRPGEAVLPAAGRLLLPGLVDCHCDAIEREIQPRPGVLLPVDLALAELDAKLALAGITTMFHGISFSAGEGLRSNEAAAELVRAVEAFCTGPAMVRHRVHLRFEVSNWQGLDLVAGLVAAGAVSLLSFMDHTPGQGQYTDPRGFREYMRKTYGAGDAEVEDIVRDKIEGRQRVGDAGIARLAGLAEAVGVPVAAHDPDTLGAVERARALHIRLAEFPITMNVAHAARERGMHVAVGAPNVLHGRSHNGNLSARDVIAAGAADVLCSDYHPAALLHAVFRLQTLGLRSVPAAVAMATQQPACATGLGDLAGAIAPGRWGDLLLVAEQGGRHAVATTVVGGEVVLENAPRLAASAAP